MFTFLPYQFLGKCAIRIAVGLQIGLGKCSLAQRLLRANVKEVLMTTTSSSRNLSDQTPKAIRSPDRPHPEEVAHRAYELFKKRGAVHGHDLEDWYEAELQLVRERDVPFGRA
jgi:hypothetical protein